MTKRTKIGLGFMLSILVIFAATASFAAPNTGIGRMKGDFAGFDASDHTVILSTKNGFVTFSVGANAQIYRNGAMAQMEDLVIGERLEVQYDRQTMEVLSVNATFATITGFITSIKMTPNFKVHYVITVTPMSARPVQLKIGAVTVITRDGVPAKATDLKIGDSATATFDPLSMMAIKIAALSPASKPATVKGVISEMIYPTVTAGSPTCWMIVEQFPSPGTQPLKIQVTSNTKITIDGVEEEMYDLRKELGVVVVYDPVKMIAIKIDGFTKLPY